MDKAVLAYSGGVDTSVAIRWLREKYNLDIITLTVDIGNVANMEAIKQKALDVGAIKAIVIDARKPFVNSFVFPALQADAIYEGRYPLATALGRPLIAQLMVDTAKKEGATTIAHGCTGKGNDQVRFDVCTAALAPELKVIAPAREWGMTREQTIAYAQKYNIPIPITVSSPYSIDENLWGRSAECGVLENPWNEPPEDAFEWTKPSAVTPAKADYLEIGFAKGIPISFNGEELDGITLIQKIHDLAAMHGVGRIDHVENRLVGIKSREIYEAPAAVVLLQAHLALEGLVMTRDQLRFKDKVATYVESSQRYATGTIRIKLYKGTCQVVGRKSPYSLYDFSLATYDKGDVFDQSASPGFIHLWGLPVRTQARIQQSNK